MSKSIARGVEKSKEDLNKRLDEIEKEVETTEQNVTISNDTLKQINDLLSQAFMQGKKGRGKGPKPTIPPPTKKPTKQPTKLTKLAEEYVQNKETYDALLQKKKTEVEELLKQIQGINVEGKLEHQNRIRDAINDIQTNAQQQIMVLLCKMEDRAAGRQTKWEACMSSRNTQG